MLQKTKPLTLLLLYNTCKGFLDLCCESVHQNRQTSCTNAPTLNPVCFSNFHFISQLKKFKQTQKSCKLNRKTAREQTPQTAAQASKFVILMMENFSKYLI